ncbi:MAG TPA: hypothetical protein VHK69_22370 [Chitinophagaceae bacterium]|nr:hypothetical protein [Chitinophagaceae bacterium]
MNRKRTIQKRLTAMLLVVLFLFIHVGKVLHRHETGARSHAYPAAAQWEKGGDCAVCDYHFTKDADLALSLPPLPAPQYSSTFLIHYQKASVASIGLPYADRGPPARA